MAILLNLVKSTSLQLNPINTLEIEPTMYDKQCGKLHNIQTCSLSMTRCTPFLMASEWAVSLKKGNPQM